MSVVPGAVPATLSVTVQLDGQVVRLVAVGEIDMSTADVLRASLNDALDKNPPAVVVDMAGVTFLDSTGIAAFVVARNRAIGENTTLTLINCGSIIRQVLEVTGLLGPLTGEY
jgi:anti-sigma B factor antagonist/stage II sporulation protein AA (anti-sigma F factor antagonist)